jgi:hypothetical protein
MELLQRLERLKRVQHMEPMECFGTAGTAQIPRNWNRFAFLPALSTLWPPRRGEPGGTRASAKK